MITKKVVRIGTDEIFNSEVYLYENGEDVRVYYRECDTGIWFVAENNHCTRVNDDIVFEICEEECVVGRSE